MAGDPRDAPEADVVDDGRDDERDSDFHHSSDVDPFRGRPAALGLALAGFVALLAAQTLPWQVFEAPAGVNDTPQLRDQLERGIGQLNVLPLLMYNLSVGVMLALVGLTLAMRPKHSRAAAAAALGWIAGHLVLLAGVLGDSGSSEAELGNTPLEGTAGIGLYLGFAAVALLGGAAGIVLWRPRPARRPVETRYHPDDEDGDDGIELTVTSAPPVTVTPLQAGDGR